MEYTVHDARGLCPRFECTVYPYKPCDWSITVFLHVAIDSNFEFIVTCSY